MVILHKDTMSTSPATLGTPSHLGENMLIHLYIHFQSSHLLNVENTLPLQVHSKE